LEPLLGEPILQLPTAGQADKTLSATFAYQLRFLVIKNLAAIIAASPHANRNKALELYHEALTMDREDIVIWNRMGSLVSNSTVQAGNGRQNGALSVNATATYDKRPQTFLRIWGGPFSFFR
jgi:hypothetical protein